MTKLYRALLTLLALCTITIFFLTGQTWIVTQINEPEFPALSYSFTGRELAPSISGLLVVPATAIFGLIAAKGLAQRVVGLIVLATGVTLIVLSISIPTQITTSVENLVSQKIGRTAIDYELTQNIFSQLLVLPAVGIAIVGLLFLVRNFDLAKKRANYDQVDLAKTPQTQWQALDSGFDPTISEADK
jgi:hypothetical protein